MTNKITLLALAASPVSFPNIARIQNAEVEPRDMDQITLVGVRGMAHAPAIKSTGEAALDHFAAFAHGLLCAAALRRDGSLGHAQRQNELTRSGSA
jgi:hypothetical protein